MTPYYLYLFYYCNGCQAWKVDKYTKAKYCSSFPCLLCFITNNPIYSIK